MEQWMSAESVTQQNRWRLSRREVTKDCQRGSCDAEPIKKTLSGNSSPQNINTGNALSS
jgi:hypothetical protein